MKFSFALASALLAASSVFAAPVEGEAAEVSQFSGCASREQAVPFLRAFNPRITDHFYTTNVNEFRNAVQNLGYQAEGITALIFPRQERNTVPLFRLFNGQAGDHFYTTNRNERNNARANLGYQDEGIAGFVYPRGICNSIPLFRLFNGQTVDHLYTTSNNERISAQGIGYAPEGIAAWVLPAGRLGNQNVA